jgi:sodium/potassium-transporting ATPase subunit alpha
VADVGICCGTSPAEVTIEVADVVCLENNFISIVRGIEEGRLIFDNLKKSIAYALSSNIAQLAPFLVYAVIRLPLPFTTTLCLVVALCTDFVPAVSLSRENPEGDIMRRPPPTHRDGVYTRALFLWSYFQIGIIEAVGAIYTYFVVLNIEGYQPEVLWWRGWFYFTLDSPPFNNHSVQENLISLKLAQTSYFAAIVIQQIVVALVVRTRRQSIFTHGLGNYRLNLAILWSFATACFIIYTPAIRDFFGTSQLPFIYWLPSLPWAVLIFEFDELRKLVIRCYGEESWVGRINAL